MGGFLPDFFGLLSELVRGLLNDPRLKHDIVAGYRRDWSR
jgi:hypothetical protein